MPHKDPADRAECQRRRRERTRELTPPPGEAPHGDAPPDTPLDGPGAGDPDQGPPVPLGSAVDVLSALAEALNAVRADRRANPQVKARSVGFLCSVALKAIEQGDLARQLAELKTLLGANP